MGAVSHGYQRGLRWRGEVSERVVATSKQEGLADLEAEVRAWKTLGRTDSSWRSGGCQLYIERIWRVRSIQGGAHTETASRSSRRT